MLRMGVISHSKSPYACPLVALKKPDGSLRACCDTRKINMITEFDAEPVPDQEEIFAKLSKDCYFSKIDLSKASRETNYKDSSEIILRVGRYYRKFVPNFAAVAVPLTNCTKKGEPNVIRWGESQEQAFQTLKSKLASSPILQLPDLHREFTLRTDASDTGVGAILLQEFAGEKFPVAYASKKLNKSQMRYSVMERECLAVVWAVLKFEPYLYGKEFVIETDHQPLTCIRKSKVANGRIMRWALALQPYRYRIQVIKGADNVGADYLSRSTEIMQANFLSFISKEL
ncbi:hypothetical protein BSL78_19890 [Apostichopus japonicus]|uniref:Reverse transcriptase RNase H-like domain-containing protein n=1 Tax=Stichopus japonicus TaxID=307972 RepID=A0A2G8K5J2_STIJA|nr:hypothetical protein BSL78_19890 [Apostichopus japonicus]